MDHGCGRSCPSPGCGSGDADRDPASKVQHSIQGIDGDVHLGRATPVRARAQPGVTPWNGVLAVFGDHAASRNLRSSRSRLARPYIWRLRVFSRLICPSTWGRLRIRVKRGHKEPTDRGN